MAFQFRIQVLFLGIPELLFRVFTDDPEVLALGGPLLMLGAAFQVADAVGIFAGCSLRGAGDTRWCFAVHVTLAWLLRRPRVYRVGVALEGGVRGAWMGELGFVLVLSTAFGLRFRSRAWHRVEI